MISLGRVPGPGNAAGRNRRWHLLWVGGLALSLAAAALFLNHRGHRLGSIAPLRPVSAKILPGVSMLAELGPSVVYVIETAKGLVLIDYGIDADAAPLKAKMARLGLDWKRVHAVLLTHAHGDQTGGAEHLRTAAGARIYAGRGDAGVPTDGASRRVAFFSVFHFPEHAIHPTTVDVELDGDEVLDFGDVRIRALATPGHTPGSTCYLMERNGLRILFSGDVITSLLGEPTNHTPLRNPLGTYQAYLPPRYRGDAAAYLDSLRRIRALPVPDLVLPGHPGSDSTPQSPQLSQKRWETMLDQGIREMTTLVARYQADGADFLDDRPKVLLKDLYYLGDFHGKAVYGLDTDDRFLVVTSAVASGLGDFVREGRKPAPPGAARADRNPPHVVRGVHPVHRHRHGRHPSVNRASRRQQSDVGRADVGTTVPGLKELEPRTLTPRLSARRATWARSRIRCRRARPSRRARGSPGRTGSR